MTTLASLEPCGTCLCCQAGKRCARTLLLDAKDEGKLRRIFAIIGEPSGRTIQKTTPIARARARRAEPPEPTEFVTCPGCREPFEFVSYAVATLRAGRYPMPPCPECREGGKQRQRADLA